MAAVRAGCSQIGRSSCAMAANNGSNTGSSSGRPASGEKICTPAAPSWLMARLASSTEPMTSVRQSAATKPAKRSGCFAHSSAMASLATRASASPWPGVANILDRRIGQRNHLAVIAELIHFAKPRIEIVDLAARRAAAPRYCRASARPCSSRRESAQARCGNKDR